MRPEMAASPGTPEHFRAPERLENSQEAAPGGSGFGVGGGNGSPSAYSVRSIIVVLPAMWLTEWTAESTIKAARTKTAKLTGIFFKGVASSATS
jgi:hypothetical protein